MKHFIVIIICLCCISTLQAQKKDKDSGQDPNSESSLVDKSEYELQKSIALMALKYNDALVAKNALYKMIALRPDRKDLVDSLAYLYYQMGSYTECILVTRELLEKNPDNIGLLEIKAVSEQNIGLTKLALEDYEILYPKTKSIYHLYQIAGLQYDLKRFGECNLSIQALLKDEKLKESKIQIFLGQGQSQEVKMEAGVYNMQGMILLNLNKEEEANSKFNKALELEPEFVLPKNNLQAMKKNKEGNK